MSYFRARVGPCPVGGMESDGRRPKTGGRASGSEDWNPAPYFAAHLGPRSSSNDGQASGAGDPKPRSTQSKVQGRKSEMACPLCRGVLQRVRGLYHCTGRCATRWLEESPGHLLDVVTLPFGICACCEGPQPLVRCDNGAVCPATGREYLLLPEGPAPRDLAAPLGLCQCCFPPMPLVERDETLVCRVKLGNRYERLGDQVRLVSTPEGTPTLTETLEAIDTALNQNSARLTRYGLFDFEE